MSAPAYAFVSIIGLDILSRWIPPFRGRAFIFVPSIMVCALIAHSKRISVDTQTSYLLGSGWPIYMSAIDKLLFTTPEIAFWRVGEKQSEAYSCGFGFEKLWWSIGQNQLLNPRGLGWNYQVKYLPQLKGRRDFQSRWTFCYYSGLKFFLMGLAYDFWHAVFHSQNRGNGETFIKNDPFIWRCANTIAVTYVIFAGLRLAHLALSMAVVGLGISHQEEWPPLYGSIRDAFTVRRAWSRFWHKMLRRTFTAYADAVVRVLNLKGHSRSLVHMYFVFFLSGICHAIPFRVLFENPRIPMGTLFFFTSQAVAITIEEAVVGFYKHAFPNMKLRSKLWHHALGFLWVGAWFYWSLPFFLDDFVNTGMMKATAPDFYITKSIGKYLGWIN